MEMIILSAVIAILITFIFFLGKRYLETRKENKRYYEIYKPIVDVDEEIKKKKSEVDSIKSEVTDLSEKYSKARDIFERLEDEIKIYEDNIELMDFGIYSPQFDFDTSEEYKKELTEIKEYQKKAIKNERAAVCNTAWTVGESAKKGEVMIKRAIKLTLRAFNGECDALIAKVKWNNVEQCEKRIEKTFNAINNLNKSNDIHITYDYYNLKIKELKLTHELELKKYEEKEEQRSIREQMREEEKLQREIEKTQRDAEKNERQYQKALEQAHKELGQAQGAELSELNAEIAKLQKELQEAKEAKERAISRAQMTKSGHVYIISNIGSFGENIYKIGMTRRLEPIDRVKELGDASVPFGFDVHAMIYSENAPELENKLHIKFGDKRVNLINNRKEYFNIKLDDIEDAVEEYADSHIEFTKIAEAREYRETIAMLKKLSDQIEQQGKKAVDAYPEALF